MKATTLLCQLVCLSNGTRTPAFSLDPQETQKSLYLVEDAIKEQGLDYGVLVLAQQEDKDFKISHAPIMSIENFKTVLESHYPEDKQ
jgi:hypothetical protein